MCSDSPASDCENELSQKELVSPPRGFWLPRRPIACFVRSNPIWKVEWSRAVACASGERRLPLIGLSGRKTPSLRKCSSPNLCPHDFLHYVGTFFFFVFTIACQCATVWSGKSVWGSSVHILNRISCSLSPRCALENVKSLVSEVLIHTLTWMLLDMLSYFHKIVL